MAIKKNGAHLRVPRKCPRCKMPSAQTAPLNSDSRPVPGVYTMCQRCGMVEVVRESGQVSAMSALEWGALDDADRAHLLTVEDGRRRVVGG